MSQEEIQNALDEAVRFCSPVVAQLLQHLLSRIAALEESNQNTDTVRRGRNN